MGFQSCARSSESRVCRHLVEPDHRGALARATAATPTGGTSHFPVDSERETRLAARGVHGHLLGGGRADSEREIVLLAPKGHDESNPDRGRGATLLCLA